MESAREKKVKIEKVDSRASFRGFEIRSHFHERRCTTVESEIETWDGNEVRGYVCVFVLGDVRIKWDPMATVIGWLENLSNLHTFFTYIFASLAFFLSGCL